MFSHWEKRINPSTGGEHAQTLALWSSSLANQNERPHIEIAWWDPVIASKEGLTTTDAKKREES